MHGLFSASSCHRALETDEILAIYHDQDARLRSVFDKYSKAGDLVGGGEALGVLLNIAEFGMILRDSGLLGGTNKVPSVCWFLRVLAWFEGVFLRSRQRILSHTAFHSYHTRCCVRNETPMLYRGACRCPFVCAVETASSLWSWASVPCFVPDGEKQTDKTSSLRQICARLRSLSLSSGPLETQSRTYSVTITYILYHAVFVFSRFGTASIRFPCVISTCRPSCSIAVLGGR